MTQRCGSVNGQTEVEIPEAEEKKEKRDSFRDLCDNIKCTHGSIIGVLAEKKEKGQRIYLKTL